MRFILNAYIFLKFLNKTFSFPNSQFVQNLRNTWLFGLATDKKRGRRFNRVACYDTVYIVSNIPLTEQYTKMQQSEPTTWAAFLRRITAVYNFDISKETPVNKQAYGQTTR